MGKTMNEIVRETTESYLANIATQAPLPPPGQIEADLLADMEAVIDLENAMRQKNRQFRCPQKLDPAQIARIIAALHPICKLPTGGGDADLLAIYQPDGPDAGTYVTDELQIRRTIRQYNGTIRRADVEETMDVLRELVPRRERCAEPNLIAVNNGIFDYDAKKLMPFTPELVFLSKSRVDYVENPANPVIHNDEDGTDWDVEGWMNELSDDPEVVELLWQILGAIIRPLVPWNKMALFYSEQGNNGKGTLCELMRQLCGAGTYTSIPLESFGREFLLESLLHASAVITDENDVGTYLEKGANLKAAVTGDAIQINRKHKTAITFQFRGFMVQCLNEMPRIRDKSDSFFRRQLFVPFLKCFTGVERKYIKTDYLHRKDVLEYVLHRVLNMDYYELAEPEACKLALEEYKEYNDPVRQFAEEVLPQAKWDLLPFAMLYEMYKAWFDENLPSGKVQGRNKFIGDLLAVVQNNPEWECRDKKQVFFGSDKMACCEPLLDIYNLTDWMNPQWVKSGSATPEQRCTPIAGQYAQLRFRGLVRKGRRP